MNEQQFLSDSLIAWFFENIASQPHSSENNKLLEKLTVYIPTCGRHEFLLRAISFWAGSPVQLIIGDGSKEPLPLEVQETINYKTNMHYFHNIDGPNRRLTIAAQLVERKYVIIMGDDEFLLKHGLIAAIEALENNDDFVACIGQSVRFEFDCSSGIKYGDGYPHQGYVINQNFIGERLLAAMKNYNAATCYSVLRRDVWVKSFGSGLSFSSPYANEIYQAMMTYIIGKLMSVNDLYWLNSFELQPVHDDVSFNRKLSFSEWWSKTRFRGEQELFVKSLINELMVNGIKSTDEARKIVDKAISQYLEFELRNKLSNKNSSLKIVSLFRKWVRKLLNETVITIVKKLVGRSTAFSVQAEFNFGSLDEFIAAKFGSSFELSQEIKVEMQLVETLIHQFHTARALKSFEPKA